MSNLNQELSSKILNIVREVEKLNDVERLLLYLQLPCGRTELPEGKYKSQNGNFTPQKQSTDIFSKKPDQETTQTYTWILSHLEEDPNVSLPKQEVYDEYRAFCQANRFEPLCVADFGKAMKHALPCIKPRRLGQRGNSRYCYSGLRKKYKLETPSLPNLMLSCDLQSPTTSTCGSLQAVMTEHHYPNGNARRTSAALNVPTAAGPLKAVGLSQSANASCQQYECASQAHPPGGHHGGKIVNLKIEPCTPGQQSQCVAIMVPDCCGTAPSSSQTLVRSGMQSHMITPDQYQQHQHQQQHQLQPTTHANNYQHQNSFTHRCGTPDDDDYRHNYHDLNRPIVGQAVIPFSQSIHAQLAQQPAQNNCFISYTSQTALPQEQQQQQQQQEQRQQHEVASQQQQQSVVSSPCCQDVSANKTEKVIVSSAIVTNTTTSTQQLSSGGHQRTSFMTNNVQNINNNHDQQNEQAGPNHQRHHHHRQSDALQPHLNLNLNLLDNCAGSSMEYCASPFQSPASTPYPMSGLTYYSTTAAQDTQDFFSSECPIQYPDH